MNSFAYLFHQFAARLGIVPTRTYLRNATEEAILLAEAEVLLGKLAWQDVEHIEDIATEYWNLRELQREQNEANEKLAEGKEFQQKLMQQPNDAPSELLERSADMEQKIAANRSEYLDSLAEVQDLINQSNKLYKKFNGLKLKLNVLKTEGVAEDSLATIRDQLRQTRDEYSRLARVIANDKERTRQLEKRGAIMQEELAQVREEITQHHRTRTRNIAETSKVIVEYSARIEQLEKKKRELQKEIGKFLCRESGKMNELAEVNRKFSPILKRTRSLMESIRLNYRLADFR